MSLKVEPRSAPSAGLAIDVLVQSPLWDAQPAAERTIRQAIEAAATQLGAKPGEVSAVLTDDGAIRALNRQWRKIDKATNVLSFRAGKSAAASSPAMLGDIIVAYETVARECAEEGRVFLHHLAHLGVHGFLHLIGYDHQTDAEADSMERLESAILAKLGMPDPYLGRDLRD